MGGCGGVCVCVCVWKYTSKYGVLGECCLVFFSETTFLLAKTPMVSKQEGMREFCCHYKLSSGSDKERKKTTGFSSHYIKQY